VALRRGVARCSKLAPACGCRSPRGFARTERTRVAHGSAGHVIAAVEVFLGVALLGLIGFVLGNKIRNS
jgi:hypothetical protein